MSDSVTRDKNWSVTAAPKTHGVYDRVTQAEKADLIEVERRWLSVAHDFGSTGQHHVGRQVMRNG